MTTQRSMLAAYVANLDDYVLKLEAGRAVPPLLLTAGYEIHCEPTDTVLYLIYEICARRCYGGRGFYAPKSGDTVMDCGAHVGVFTISLSAAAPGIRVHCFEPCRRTREYLLRNVQTNNLGDAVSVHAFALSSRKECRLLSVGAESGHSSLYEYGSAGLQIKEAVECISLGDAVRQCGVDHVDLLKIDVEGAEWEIMEGSDAETWRRIERVSVEFHDNVLPGTRHRLISAFIEKGYRIVGVDTAPPFNERTGIILAARLPGAA